MTDLNAGGRTTTPGKRERLIDAARELTYRRGVAGTSLADIAAEASVPVGNVYYYFKTKEDLVAEVVRSRLDQLRALFAELERRHESPKARLEALGTALAGQQDVVARYGCPYGTLGSELAKRADGTDALAAPLIQAQLEWARSQFEAMGRSDADDLAATLIARHQGAMVLTGVLADPALLPRLMARTGEWVQAL